MAGHLGLLGRTLLMQMCKGMFTMKVKLTLSSHSSLYSSIDFWSDPWPSNLFLLLLCSLLGMLSSRLLYKPDFHPLGLVRGWTVSSQNSYHRVLHCLRMWPYLEIRSLQIQLVKLGWGQTGVVWTPNPTGLCPYKKRILGDRHAHRENTPWRWRQRSGRCLMKTRLSKGCQQPPEARRETWDRFPIMALIMNLPWQLLTSRTVTQYISLVEAIQFVALCFDRPRKLIQVY